MQKAVYGPQPERHFALNMENYCHFTSPIRRYPDLTVHRLLDQMAAGRKPRQDMPELESVSQHCSEMEQRAAVAERTLTKLKLLNYLANRIGEELPAVVTGVEEYGLFVQGTEIPADGLLRVDSLPKDSYRFAAETYSLTGFRKGNQFRLGDRLQVKVMRVDVDRRELDFRLVKVLEQPGGPRTARTQEDSPGRRRTANKSNKSAKSSKSSKSGKRGAGRRKRRG
jgi:ribonuclease R